MHVRIRLFGKPDTIVVVESKLTKIDQLRRLVEGKFNVPIKSQRLLYGGKQLENGYTFHDYNIKLNDVIQLMIKSSSTETETKTLTDNKNGIKDNKDEEKKNIVYKDTTSKLYAIGDLIDMRDQEQGAWFEGKIIRIVLDPENIKHNNEISENGEVKKEKSVESELEDKNTENISPNKKSDIESPVRKKTIQDFFKNSSKATKVEENGSKSDEDVDTDNDVGLLYKIHLDADEEEDNKTDHYCKLENIRPRARNVIDVQDLKVGQCVMVNHNTEDISEKGYWYDLKITEIKKLRTTHELIGTLYLGPQAVPQDETRVKLLDKVYAIEKVVPLSQRTEEYSKLMVTPTHRRSQPLHCLTCRDDEDAPCKDCGCYQCSGKEAPEKIILCDECNNGYHMYCLTPALSELPDDDWYCPSCRRDPNDVIAPGAGKQTRRAAVSNTKRDWGRGMACVGKTKTCAMPSNHFGPIPGIEVGMTWRFRIQLSESGVHRPPVSGIHGRDTEGAYSIVLSGGYEDDVDHGLEFTYTGSGGRDLSGNKRTAEQSCDQTLTRENKALARNCAVKLNEGGADAGENWREGRPVRVVRSFKMIKHFPKYAPKEGIRYDGIYKIVKYYPETGKSGFKVWKYLLRRDDPNPAPWEPGAKHFDIVYPDGYLEAEAEKKALKEKGAQKNKEKQETQVRRQRYI